MDLRREQDRLEKELAEELLEEEPPCVRAASPLATLALTQAPWWIISALFHGLMVLFLSLITWVIHEPELREVMLYTTLEPPQPTIKVDKPLKEEDIGGPQGAEVPPIDPGAEEFGKIWVPEDVLRQAVWGNTWKTFNPDLPDTGGAHGVEEALAFYSREGVVDAPGGGGLDGLAPEAVIRLIGPGFGSPGSGGGEGGGKGKGIGPGVGDGKGTFGRRTDASREWMIKVHKGAGTLGPVLAALNWLAGHQESDGHWDARKYGAIVKTDTACTGFALLAFLGYGHTEKIGEHRAKVQGAVRWLISKQNEEGLIYDASDAGGHRGGGYPHAIAGLALAEAAGMARVPETMKAAQKAVDYSCRVHQQGQDYDKLGWRYRAGQPADLSVSGWFIMQLKSAAVGRLHVEHTSFDGAKKFLDSVEHKGAGGDSGYGPASVYWYQPENPHEQTAYRLTTIGALSRQFLGAGKNELEPTVRWFVEKGGVPDAWTSERADLYYWYYGTLATFQQGGESWERWNTAMKKTLCGSQRRDGDEKGSWDALGAYSNEWGRVGQTALCCLCLEVYYRYGSLYR
jgi:hypothetical protein